MAVVTRYYESIDQATRAYQALLDVGYNKKIVALIKDTSSPQSGTDGGMDLSDLLKAGAILKEDTQDHSSNLNRGYSMVAIETPYGKTVKAIRILDGFNPVSIPGSEDIGDEKKLDLISEQADPFSTAIGLTTLVESGHTTSLSFGFNTLTNKRSFLPIFGELARSDYSFSGMFGMSCLTNNAAPYSAYLGNPLSRDKSGDSWTRSHGFKMISNNPSPLSGLIGLPLLVGDQVSESHSPLHTRSNIRNNPAPLSNMFGLPQLSKKPQTFLARIFPALTGPRFSIFGFPKLSDKAAPLSSMFGIPCLSGKSGDDWRYSFGLPMLSSHPTPLSRALGFGDDVLLDDSM